MKTIFAALLVCGGLVANHLCKHPATPECRCEAPEGPDLTTAEPATAGKPVARGDSVLARWNHGDWWEARVVRAGNAGVVVAWADGSAPSALEAFEVAPFDRSVRPTPGDVAFCKDATSTKWSRTIAPRHGDCIAAH